MRVRLRSHDEVAIGVRRTASAGVISIVLVAGCQTVPGPNPAGLPEEARTLEYILDRGCLAYMLGEKTENEAMHALRLVHHGPGLTFVDPPGPPTWTGFYPGLSNVVVSPTLCSVHMTGSQDFDAYRKATQAVLRSRLGADAEEDARSGYRQVLPGQIFGCHRGISYTYYATRRIFSVDLRRGGRCINTERS